MSEAAPALPRTPTMMRREGKVVIRRCLVHGVHWFVNRPRQNTYWSGRRRNSAGMDYIPGNCRDCIFLNRIPCNELSCFLEFRLAAHRPRIVAVVVFLAPFPRIGITCFSR